MATSIRHDPFPVQAPYWDVYSHGVETKPGGRLLHISGQIGINPDGTLPTDFTSQCKLAISNVESVLRSANMVLTDIVKMSFFLVRREDMPALLEVRKAMLKGVRPAVTTLVVAGLVSAEWLVEIEAIAAAP